jgi:hypothetical protein
MRPFIISSAFVALGLVFGGCSGGDEEDKGSSQQSASSTDYCATVCAKTASCDGDVDTDTCQRQCEKNQGTTFANFRSDLVKSVEACVNQKDCADLFTSDQSLGAQCFGEELVKISPTAAAEAFCDRAEATYRQCHNGQLDIPGCLLAVKAFNDGVLAEAQGCFDKTCEGYNACLDATIDVTFEAP